MVYRVHTLVCWKPQFCRQTGGRPSYDSFVNAVNMFEYMSSSMLQKSRIRAVYYGIFGPNAVLQEGPAAALRYGDGTAFVDNVPESVHTERISGHQE